jgi:uncharacterized membrane protein
MIKKIIKILLILLLLDSIYLTTIGYNLFSKMIKKITKENLQFNLLGLISYLFLSFGLYYFIIKDKKSIYDSFILGLIIYGVYDFTNIGIFKNYDLFTAICDMLWGGILFSLTNYIFIRNT